MKNTSSLLAFLLVLAVVAGCNGSFTTANISELRFGRNNKADPAMTAFNTGEDIYALAAVSNAPDKKYKLTWKITYADVPGKAKDEELGTNTVDFEGSKQLWQSFSTPLPGQYKVEATLTDEAGKPIDSKSGTLTVAGSGTEPDGTSKKKPVASDSN